MPWLVMAYIAHIVLIFQIGRTLSNVDRPTCQDLSASILTDRRKRINASAQQQ